MSTKTIALICVLLLLTQAFALSGPQIKKRKLSNLQLQADTGIHSANNKQLYSKKAKNHCKKKLNSCLESVFSSVIVNLTHKSGSLERFKRSFETVGTCLTTVNKIRITQRSIDYVCTEPFNFETLTSFSTNMKELATTTEKRHFKISHVTCVQRLSTQTATIQVVVPMSVTVEVLTNVSTYVDTLTCTKACVQTLTSVSKMARTFTTEKVCAKRLTSASCSIRALKTVHEVIKQRAARSVKCINMGNKFSKVFSGNFQTSSSTSKDQYNVSNGNFLGGDSNSNSQNNNNSYNNNSNQGSN